jgi:hypothetical protein
MPAWKTAINVLLVFIAIFRMIIGCTVDVAMTMNYPLALKDCAACTSAMCAVNCSMRSAIHLDMGSYVESGVDPVTTALGLPLRLMTGFYFAVVGPFMVALVYALWAKKEWIRLPAIGMGAVLFCLMSTFVLANLLGHPPSTNPVMLLASNSIDIMTPFLILARTVPTPFLERPARVQGADT